MALYHLFEGELRFNEIRRKIPNVAQRMLTTQLRELEADGLVIRTVYPAAPPKMELRLSDRGQTLRPAIMALKDWADAHMDLSDGGLLDAQASEEAVL